MGLAFAQNDKLSQVISLLRHITNQVHISLQSYHGISVINVQ
jgi:hypothetical protein